MQAGKRAGTARQTGRQTEAGGVGGTYKQATCKTLIK